jgi:hypothetical protein
VTFLKDLPGMIVHDHEYRMPMYHAAVLAFLLPGLLFVAAGTSLALRKTTVDVVLGLRSVKPFADPTSARIASDVLGFDMIVAGAVVSTTAIANAFAGLGVAFNVSVLLSSVLVAIAHVMWTMRNV